MPKPAIAPARAPHRPRHRQAEPQAPPPPPRPALQAIREDQDEIVEALLAQAKKGSYLHAKFLFEYGGLSSASDEERALHEQSLAEMLIERLRVLHPNSP